MAQPVKPPTVSALPSKAQPVRKRSKAPALSIAYPSACGIDITFKTNAWAALMLGSSSQSGFWKAWPTRSAKTLDAHSQNRSKVGRSRFEEWRPAVGKEDLWQAAAALN